MAKDDPLNRKETRSNNSYMMYCELHDCKYIEWVLPQGTIKLKYILFHQATCKHGCYNFAKYYHLIHY